VSTLVRWPADSFRHTQAWRTDVQKSRDGLERRVCLSQSPRDRYELGIPLTTAQALQVRGWLLNDPAGTYEIPLRFERLLATAEVTDGDFQTGGITLSDWAVAGQRVLVESLIDPDDYYTAEIDSVASAPTITLDTLPPGGMDFPAGLTAISPLVDVLLENGQAIGHYKVNEGYWSMAARAAAVRASFGDGASLTSLSSVPILDRVPMDVGLGQEQAASGVEIQDAGGAIATTWPRTVSDIRRSHRWQVANTAAERQWWKLFLYTVRGRQKPFLLSTYQHDLVAASNPAGTSLIVEGPPTTGAADYVTDWWPSLAHRRLHIVDTAGASSYRAVTAAVDNLDGTQTLTIASLTATVARISFLELCRFDTDEVVTEYSGPDVGEISPEIMVVQQ